MSNSKLFRYATEEAKQAVSLDKAGKYNEAYNKYMRAAEILLKFMKFNKNEVMRQKCDQMMQDYMKRAKELKAKLSGMERRKSRRRGKTVVKSKSKKNLDEEDYGEEEEEMSEEERELRNSIAGTILTESPDVEWSDIAGLDTCKQALREAIVLPMIKPDLFRGARKPWSGILLYGPPGCGKTLLAKAAAGEVESTFFNVSSADLLSKWLGESEKLISSLFRLARLKAPSLIFIDEIDSVATKRGSGNESSGERRVKTQLLSEIQGLKTKNNDLLLVLGATNRPWDIDNAMLSRFEKKVHVPLPDKEARKGIFRIHTAGIESDLEEEDFAELAVRTEGYSGRDIANICREVIMIPVRELDMKGLLEHRDQEVKVRPIKLDDFLKTLKKVKPMTTGKDLERFTKWSEEYGESV
ncbi:MAG: AAA family ATPase [Promethearchaeia archaeon]